MPYRKYWENEVPTEARSPKVWASYFPKAGKLQLARVWKDEDGNAQRGKTTTLDREDLAAHPDVRTLLDAFLASAAADGQTV